MSRRALPLPVRFLVLVLGVVVAPLTLMGLWLAGSAARSGEDLLRSRLGGTNSRVTAEIASNWLRPRSALLSFGEDPRVQEELRRRATDDGLTGQWAAEKDVSSAEASSRLPQEVAERFDALPEHVVEVALLDVAGRIVWRLSRGPTALPTFEVLLPVHARPGGRMLGSLEARLLGSAVMGATGLASATAGAVVAVIDPEGGASLRGLPFDPVALASDRFEWDEETWVSERRILLDPRLDIISAAPLAEFSSPFQSAARRGLAGLMVVTLTATVLAAILTRRMTRSLARLAIAAETLSRGDLTTRVPVGERDEVGRVSEAFNRMAESLKRTLAELSQRQALAAVGSFASELAHEVRNPLTSIKVDLQYVEEQLHEGSEVKAVQRSALEEIVRLDRTVSGVLQIARSGRIAMEPLDIREPLRAAVYAVEARVERVGGSVRTDLPPHPVAVQGDRGALQQLFTNLLMNAAQAVEQGGTVAVCMRDLRGAVQVEIQDDGLGIPAEHLARIREPFFSTRADGTGLGLAIADRVAAAHRAELEIDSEPGKGTTVRVRFGGGGGG